MSRSARVCRAAVVLLSLVAACQAADVASPSRRAAHAPLTDALGFGDDDVAPTRAPRLLSCGTHAPAVRRAVFGPSGGVLEVGGSYLIIPGGALRDTVTITGTRTGDGTSLVRFEPHGLQFRKEAHLVLSGQGCDFPAGAVPLIGYIGAGNTILETIPAEYLPRWKLVGAPIEHFSGYAILF